MTRDPYPTTGAGAVNNDSASFERIQINQRVTHRKMRGDEAQKLCNVF